MGQPPQPVRQAGPRARLRIAGAATDARFFISTAPALPHIELTAELDGAPSSPVQFTWTFALDYREYIVTRLGQRRIAMRAKSHSRMAPIVSADPCVVVPLREIMCGRLTVNLSCTVGGQVLTAKRDDILIGSTNPSAFDLASVILESIVRQMIRQESQAMQFNDHASRTYVSQAINPNWSGDGLRGVGLGQLTVPPPADGDIWNWRTNARSLLSRFKEKRSDAARFTGRVEASQRLKEEVAALNAWRAAEGQGPVVVTVPALTDAERDREALRGYNGFGPEVPGQYLPHIHEYEPKRSAVASGKRKDAKGVVLMSPPLLVVDGRGAIQWEQISGAERRRRYVAAGTSVPGEPDYVAKVLAQPS